VTIEVIKMLKDSNPSYVMQIGLKQMHYTDSNTTLLATHVRSREDKDGSLLGACAKLKVVADDINCAGEVRGSKGDVKAGVRAIPDFKARLSPHYFAFR